VIGDAGEAGSRLQLGRRFLLAKTQLAPRALPCSEKAREHRIYSRRHKVESNRWRKCMRKPRRGRIRPGIDSAQECPPVLAQSGEDLAGPRAPARGIAYGSVDDPGRACSEPCTLVSLMPPSTAHVPSGIGVSDAELADIVVITRKLAWLSEKNVC
jgi:hypothetical protein